MSKHLEHEVEKLKKHLLGLSALVERNLHRAVKAVQEKDVVEAQQTMEADHEIDQREVDLEEECLKILALHQPVANDLRFIVAVLKINNDLERIGDLSVNMAERAMLLSKTGFPDVKMDFAGMALKVEKMLRDSLDSLVRKDVVLAQSVCAADDEVDDMNRDIYEAVKEGIRQHPDHINSLIHLLSVSRHLERAADHATNIAEDVIYMIAGDIVRHRSEEYDI